MLILILQQAKRENEAKKSLFTFCLINLNKLK